MRRRKMHMSIAMNWNSVTIANKNIFRNARIENKWKITLRCCHVGSSTRIHVPLIIRWIEWHCVHSLIKISWNSRSCICLWWSWAENSSTSWRTGWSGPWACREWRWRTGPSLMRPSPRRDRAPRDLLIVVVVVEESTATTPTKSTKCILISTTTTVILVVAWRVLLTWRGDGIVDILFIATGGEEDLVDRRAVPAVLAAEGVCWFLRVSSISFDSAS